MRNRILFFEAISVSFILFFSLIIFYKPALAQTDDTNQTLIQMVQPQEGAEIVGKKPVIRFSVGASFARENILVMLDGTDITPVLEILPDGFSYVPVQILPAGTHQISVMGYTLEGKEFYKEFTFSSRHSQMFAEAFSNNELTAVYSTILNKSDKLDLPYSKLEGNLASNSALKEKGWDMSLTGNLRYLEQADPLPEPQTKGVDLNDYLMTIGFTQNQFGFKADVGDTSIEETPNTLSQLARRGGKLSVKFNDITMGGFVVRGKEVYGFDGGLGLKTDDTDHIMGLSGEAGILSKKIIFKGVYILGGEEGSYFGTYNETPGRKGNVYGLQVKTDFFENRLVTEYEYNYSRFDSDTSDDLDYDGDKAYRVGVNGLFEKFDYKAAYKYFGRHYGVVGNSWLEKDWEGVVLEGGANLTDHSIRAVYDQHHDNVEGDPLYPIFHTYRGKFDYSFMKIASLPITLGYERTVVDSTDEPQEVAPFETHTDTFSGSIMYTKNRLTLGLLASFSQQDDRTVDNKDSGITTWSLTPGYSWDHLSINTGFSYSLTEYHLTQVDQDAYTITLDIRGDLFDGKITYEFAGTYDRTSSTDNTVDKESFGTSGRVAYLLGKNLWGYLNPSVGIKAQYDKVSNWASTEDKEEHAVYLFFSTNLPVVF